MKTSNFHSLKELNTKYIDALINHADKPIKDAAFSELNVACEFLLIKICDDFYDEKLDILRRGLSIYFGTLDRFLNKKYIVTFAGLNTKEYSRFIKTQKLDNKMAIIKLLILESHICDSYRSISGSVYSSQYDFCSGQIDGNSYITCKEEDYNFNFPFELFSFLDQKACVELYKKS